MIFLVLNPPRGLKYAADRTFLNDHHILNVAISRAKDYLFLLYPHKEMDGFEKLYELNHIVENSGGKSHSDGVECATKKRWS